MDDLATQDEPLLGTSTLRGLLLLGGVAAVAYLAYEFWYKQRAAEGSAPAKKSVVRIPIELPISKPKTNLKK